MKSSHTLRREYGNFFVNTVTPASAVYENERQLSQRILLLAAFRTATARIRGAATGSAAIGKFLYVHPNNIRIHHGTCSNLLPTTAFHLRNKAYTYTVNLSGGHLFRRSNPILIGSDCVIKSTDAINFLTSSMRHPN